MHSHFYILYIFQYTANFREQIMYSSIMTIDIFDEKYNQLAGANQSSSSAADITVNYCITNSNSNLINNSNLTQCNVHSLFIIIAGHARSVQYIVVSCKSLLLNIVVTYHRYYKYNIIILHKQCINVHYVGFI